MAEPKTSFAEKYAGTRRARPAEVAIDVKVDAQPASEAERRLAEEQDLPLKKKSVAFTTVKGVAIGLVSALAAAGIASTLKQSLINGTMRSPIQKPLKEDMAKQFSNFVGLGIAGILSVSAYNNFQKVKEHNREVEEVRQDRGR